MGLKRMINGLRVSSYPLSYTIRYPYFSKHPSWKNRNKIIAQPLEWRFTKNQGDLTFIFSGDIIGGPESLNFSGDFKNIFMDTDLIFGNLEGPLFFEYMKSWKRFKAGGNPWQYSVPEKFLEDIITKFKIDPQKLMLSIANNHSQGLAPGGHCFMETTVKITFLPVHDGEKHFLLSINN